MEISYIAGLVDSDGSYYHDHIIITNKHREILDPILNSIGQGSIYFIKPHSSGYGGDGSHYGLYIHHYNFVIQPYCFKSGKATQIDWPYIAGFFDGDGGVQIVQGKYPNLHFFNTNKPMLERIRQFIRCGNYIETTTPQGKPYYHLSISDHNSALIVATEMLPFLIEKKEVVIKAKEILESKTYRESNILESKLTPEMFRYYYQMERVRLDKIAIIFGVTRPTLSKWAKVNGFTIHHVGRQSTKELNIGKQKV